MSDYQKAKTRDPAMFRWLVSNGWTASRYNALKNWEQAELRLQAKGGLDETSFLSLWGAAAVEVTQGYGENIKDAATATGRTVRNTMILGVIGICGVAVIVYRKPLLKLVKAVK